MNRQSKKQNRQKGFTLIELLVVIAIIALLVGVILVSLNPGRSKSRDARRISDIHQLYKALELYYDDNQGLMPDCDDPGYAGGCDLIDFAQSVSRTDSSLDGQFVPFLAPYIQRQNLADPLNTLDPPHLYIYDNNGEFPSGSGKWYLFFVVAFLEDPNHPGLQGCLDITPFVIPGACLLGDRMP